MRALIIFAVLAAAMTATAKDVEVISFRKVDSTRLGEICVKVKGEFNHHDRVIVTVDPDHNPGPYVLQPDKNGNGCLIVLTYTNRASVEYWYAGHEKQPDKSNNKKVVEIAKHAKSRVTN